MQKVRVPLNSFQYGEISENVIHRVDSPIYQASAQRLENVLVRAEGGVKKRPGMKNIFQLLPSRDTSKKLQCKLIPFIFSDDERYIVAIQNTYLRVFRIDGENVTQVSILAGVPFDDDYIHQYTYAQYGDVLFIAHPLFMPRMIIRTSLTSFTVETFSFDQRVDGLKIYQPYSVFHGNNVTLDPAATSGTNVAVTVSEAYFDTTGAVDGSGNYPDSLHVGVFLRYHDTEMEITSVQSATQARVSISGTLQTRLEIANPLRTNAGSVGIEVTHLNHGLDAGDTIQIVDASAVGGINANAINGSRLIQEIIDENTYRFDASSAANASEDGGGFVKVVTHAPTSDWAEQSFSSVRGYPAAIEFHENRLCFGGTIAEPDSLWLSKIGSFFNFDVGDAADDDSINIVAATGDVNEIRYLVSNRDLQVFTASAELYVPTYLNQAITPTNAQIRKQTPYGCEFVEPTSIDGATIFIQTGGKVAREYLYTDDEDAYTSTAVSNIASHLIDGIQDVAVVNGFAQLSEGFAVFTKANGDCTVFSSSRAEKRAGWTRFTTQGEFSSVAAIDDRLFASVWFDGSDLRLVEFKDGWQLDKSKLYSLTSKVADVSADFSDGIVLDVIAVEGDREDYLGTHTVASGSIDLSGYNPAYTEAYIGYSFPVSVTTNPIDVAAGNGPQTGNPRGISSAILDLRGTRSAKVNNTPLVTDGEFNGKKEFRLLGYGRDPQITITQDEPLSLQVNGLIAELII